MPAMPYGDGQGRGCWTESVLDESSSGKTCHDTCHVKKGGLLRPLSGRVRATDARVEDFLTRPRARGRVS